MKSMAAARLLGLIHRLVGAAHQLDQCAAVLRAAGNARAGAHGEGLTLEIHRLAYG